MSEEQWSQSLRRMSGDGSCVVDRKSVSGRLNNGCPPGTVTAHKADGNGDSRFLSGDTLESCGLIRDDSLPDEGIFVNWKPTKTKFMKNLLCVSLLASSFAVLSVIFVLYVLIPGLIRAVKHATATVYRPNRVRRPVRGQPEMLDESSWNAWSNGRQR